MLATCSVILVVAGNAEASPIGYTSTVKDVTAETMPGSITFMMGLNIPQCPGIQGLTGSYLQFAGSAETNKAVYALLLLAAATGHTVWVGADSSNPCLATQVHGNSW